LQIRLTDGEQARAYSKGTKNLDAYMKVMEASWLSQQTTIQGNIRARQLAEEAISLDPKYAFAYRALAFATIVDIWLGLTKDPQESLKKCIELYHRAIALDESFALAHAGLGYALMMARKYDEAYAKMERALELEPDSADVINSYANLLIYTGRGEEAISFFKNAIRFNPKPPNVYLRHLAVALRDTRRYEEAIAQLKKCIEREPREAAGEVLKINPKFSLESLEKIHPYKDIPEKKRYFDALRKVGLK